MRHAKADLEWMLDPRGRSSPSGHTSAPEIDRPDSCCAGCGDTDGCSSDGDDSSDPVVGITPWNLEPELVGVDWDLLRKFNTFWPRGGDGPPDMPWLGQLVTRKKAWRWVSQFPRFFQNIESDDTRAIMRFVGRTLTEVEPVAPDASSESGDKKCCKKKGPGGGGLPPVDRVPDDGHCKSEIYYSCIDCPPGEGMKVEVDESCLTVKHAVCVPTESCPGAGPIEPGP